MPSWTKKDEIRLQRMHLKSHNIYRHLYGSGATLPHSHTNIILQYENWAIFKRNISFNFQKFPFIFATFSRCNSLSTLIFIVVFRLLILIYNSFDNCDNKGINDCRPKHWDRPYRHPFDLDKSVRLDNQKHVFNFCQHPILKSQSDVYTSLTLISRCTIFCLWR